MPHISYVTILNMVKIQPPPECMRPVGCFLFVKSQATDDRDSPSCSYAVLVFISRLSRYFKLPSTSLLSKPGNPLLLCYMRSVSYRM